MVIVFSTMICLFVAVRALILDRRMDWFGSPSLAAAMLAATQLTAGWRDSLAVLGGAPAPIPPQPWRQRHISTLQSDVPALRAAASAWRGRTRAP